MKRSLVVGAGGQDGTLLVARLLARGDVVGAARRDGTRWTGTADHGHLDVLDADAPSRIVRAFLPDEVYFLAAVHGSAEGRPATEEASFALHRDAAHRLLQALSDDAPRARFFYAASSHVFEASPAQVVDERTPMAPRSAYARSKAAGVEAVRAARGRGLFACAGFLHPHESPLRGPSFVSQRVCRGLVDVARGRSRELVVGDLGAQADWGWAEDTVAAMTLVLAQPAPADHVVATGELRTVGDWVRIACRRLGLDPSTCVREEPSLLTRVTSARPADASGLRALGWAPSRTFEALVERMVEAALDRQG